MTYCPTLVRVTGRYTDERLEWHSPETAALLVATYDPSGFRLNIGQAEVTYVDQTEVDQLVAAGVIDERRCDACQGLAGVR